MRRCYNSLSSCAYHARRHVVYGLASPWGGKMGVADPGGESLGPNGLHRLAQPVASRHFPKTVVAHNGCDVFLHRYNKEENKKHEIENELKTWKESKIPLFTRATHKWLATNGHLVF